MIAGPRREKAEGCGLVLAPTATNPAGQRVVDQQSHQLDRDAPFRASLIHRETPSGRSATGATEGQGNASKCSSHRKALQRSLVEFDSQPGLLWHCQEAVVRFDALFRDKVP